VNARHVTRRWTKTERQRNQVSSERLARGERRESSGRGKRQEGKFYCISPRTKASDKYKTDIPLRADMMRQLDIEAVHVSFEQAIGKRH
jgi:hypothetical protein